MAGRKEYELLFKLTAALGGNFNAAFSSALNTTRQMQNSLQKLNSITGKIDAYKKQEAALESNRQKLERLTAEHERLQREISETGEPTEELRAKMAQNERQIAATTSRIEQQEARLNELGGELSDALAAMGLETAFDSGRANFSALGTAPDGPLYVSSVVHKARIEVNEKGTEAAAATVVGVDGAAAPTDYRELVLDRPFCYAVVDLERGVPLFLGTFERP